jgi:hypothetical protein
MGEIHGGEGARWRCATGADRGRRKSRDPLAGARYALGSGMVRSTTGVGEEGDGEILWRMGEIHGEGRGTVEVCGGGR